MNNINVHFDKIFDLLWQEGIVKWYDGIYLPLILYEYKKNICNFAYI